jgi:SAM-dependent methyltransferase
VSEPIISDTGPDAPTPEQRRLSFGAAAADYAAARPGYPDDVVRWVFDGAAHPVRDVADVGAGTGALTRTLARLAERVTAYEPDAGMLEQLHSSLPEVGTAVAQAESLPAADASLDALLAAQAWHWFDHGAAAEEFARVLRPGGVVGLVWNVRDSRVPWMAALQAIIGGEDSMRLVAAESTQSILEQEERAGLEEVDEFLPGVERATFPHLIAMTPDQLVRLTSTYSYVRLSPRADQLYAAVRELLATHPDTAGRETVDVAYITAAYRWRRP